MKFELNQISKNLSADIDQFVSKGVSEGHEFLELFVKQWRSEENCFNLPGEIFYGAFAEGDLIAIGGINRDPYLRMPQYGRVRRFFVAKEYRRFGVATALIEKLKETSKGKFDTLTLRTDNPDAARFYESVGFVPSKLKDCTHEYDCFREG